MNTAAQVRAHIEYKASVRELDPDLAARMLTALDAGAGPDYQELYWEALALPAVVFHTAPTSARASISAGGLRPAAPGDGENWGAAAAHQPAGVYVGPHPDTRGVWAHTGEWDVWQVDTTGMGEWSHDQLNPGCWILTEVPPAVLRLHGTYSAHPDH